MKKIALKNPQDTKKLAKHMASNLCGGEVLALVGELGAGKTTFTQELAKALGIKEAVKSPTFTVMQIYQTNIKSQISNAKLLLCHVDAYRMNDLEELDAIGFYDYLGAPSVITVIEWADKIAEALPTNATWMRFTYKEGAREITID